MRIIVFSENVLNNSGGAEVYALKLMEALSDDNQLMLVTAENIQCDIKDIYAKYNVPNFQYITIKRKKSSNNLIEILNRINFWIKLRNIIKKDKYDLYINTSCNRMIGFKSILKSIHLIHFPVQPYSKVFPSIIGRILDKMYQKSYNYFWANSQFTKKHLYNYWKVNSIVVNPPICMDPISASEIHNKKNNIIVVGRLVPDKKIIEMGRMFISLSDLIPDYNLVIVGNKDTNHTDYFEELVLLSQQNNKIKILTDISYYDLVQEYKKASFFWHAKGYHIDENQPLLMEHFGMTTVEAMANGCVPIVINKAGQKEIVINKQSGYLWNELEELKKYTIELINNKDEFNNMSKEAIKRSEQFLYPHFKEIVNSLIKEI